MTADWIIYGITHHINQRRTEVRVYHERAETVLRYTRNQADLEDSAVVFVQTQMRHLRASAESGTFQGIIWSDPETGKVAFTTEDEHALAPLEEVKTQWLRDLKIKVGVKRATGLKTWKSRHRAGMVRVWRRPEYQAKRRQIMQEFWADPNNRRNISTKNSAAQKFRWADPTLRQGFLDTIQENWENPAYKARVLAAMQAGKKAKRERQAADMV